jgi:glutathionylspermidine synthase
MNSNLFDREWLEEMMAQQRHIVGTGALEDVQRFLKSIHADKTPILPIPLAFDGPMYERLVAAAKALLSAQQKILSHFYRTRSRTEILELFRLPESVWPFIDWTELTQNLYGVCRFDIIPTGTNCYFCELNSDSAMGGFEVVDCLDIYSKAMGWSLTECWESPQAAIVRLLRRLAMQNGKRRIVICDWKMDDEDAYFGYELLHRHISRELPHIESHLLYHTDYPDAWLTPEQGRKTIVYRGFLHSDMQDYEFFQRLWDSGTTVVNTFETEILSDKSWFALFWDDQLRGLLSRNEVTAIEQYVPYTVRLSDENLDDLLTDKERFVFKNNSSYGGRAVFMGAEHPKAVLHDLMTEGSPEQWIAQQSVDTEGLEIPFNSRFDVSRHNLVLGLYIIGGEASGLLVRASRHSKVVNASGGITWAVPMSSDDRVRRLSRIRDLQKTTIPA